QAHVALRAQHVDHVTAQADLGPALACHLHQQVRLGTRERHQHRGAVELEALGKRGIAHSSGVEAPLAAGAYPVRPVRPAGFLEAVLTLGAREPRAIWLVSYLSGGALAR